MEKSSILSTKEVLELRDDVTQNYVEEVTVPEEGSEKLAVDLDRAKKYVRTFDLYGLNPLESLHFYVISEVPDQLINDKGMYSKFDMHTRERIIHTVDRLYKFVDGSKLKSVNRVLLKATFALGRLLG